MSGHRIFQTAFAKVYPMYVQKAERKGRTRAEVDAAIRWLTGYDQAGLERQIDQQVNFEEFFNQSPRLNPSRAGSGPGHRGRRSPRWPS